MTGGCERPGMVSDNGVPIPRRAESEAPGEDDEKPADDEWASASDAVCGRLLEERVDVEGMCRGRTARGRGGTGSSAGGTLVDMRGGGVLVYDRGEMGVAGGFAGVSDVGSASLGTLLLDSEEGGRQLPNTPSRNAEPVGEGIEYSDTDTEGRPEGTEYDMDGRCPAWSTSVSAGVRNDALSLEYLESLSVRVP